MSTTGSSQSPQPVGAQDRATARRLRRSDPLRRHHPVRGRRARIRWWHRVRALVLLSALIVGIGIILAALVGIAFFFLTFLLETVS